MNLVSFYIYRRHIFLAIILQLSENFCNIAAKNSQLFPSFKICNQVMILFYALTLLGLPTNIAMLSSPGNLVTLLILFTSELDLSNSFSQMLTALLLSDSICIIMSLLLFSLPYLIALSPYMVPILLPIAQVALTMSVYMIIALSFERFFTVTKPHRQVGIKPTTMSLNKNVD